MPFFLVASTLALTLCRASGQQAPTASQAACGAAPDVPGSASAMLQTTGSKMPSSTSAAYHKPAPHATVPTKKKRQNPARKSTFDNVPAVQRRSAWALPDATQSASVGSITALGDGAMEKQEWSLNDAPNDGDRAANSNMDERVVEDTAMQASHHHYERSAKAKDKPEVAADSEDNDDSSEDESTDSQSEEEGGEGTDESKVENEEEEAEEDITVTDDVDDDMDNSITDSKGNDKGGKAGGENNKRKNKVEGQKNNKKGANEPEEENEEEAVEEETTVTDNVDDETENIITDSKEKDKGGNAGGKNNKKDKQKNKNGKKKSGADGKGEFFWRGK